MRPIFFFDQMAVGPCGIGVADNDICAYQFAIFQFDRNSLAVFDANLGDGRVVANRHSAVFEQCHQGIDNGAGATHGRVHAPALLQDMNQ